MIPTLTLLSRRLAALVLLPYLLLFAQARGQAAELSWYGGPWAHEGSDLAPDPAVRFGRLTNGMRYAVIPNAVPSGRVSLYLNVQAGSLMETDEERGYAHFVEHMAFNGTRRFPPGSLIPFFQKNGMSFGGDTNAHTSFAETVYKLNLASADSGSLRMGLDILRDFADGMTMDEKEVRDEVGVILAEKNARDSEEARAGVRYRQTVFAGTAFVHETIGTEACVRSANREKLLNFYRRWYTPERMMLVAVGEVDPGGIEPMIEQAFSDMRAKRPAPEITSLGTPETPPLRAVLHTRNITGVHISVLVLHPRRHQRNTSEDLRAAFTGDVAALCLRQRLKMREERQPGIWNAAHFRDRSRDSLMPVVSMGAVTEASNWKTALRALAEEMQGALARGFSQREVEQAKRLLGQSLERAAGKRAGLSSGEIAGMFVAAANQDKVFTTEENDRENFAAMAPAITPDQVNAALRSAFAPENRTIHLSGNLELPNAEQDILEAWKTADTLSIATGEAGARPFPYLELPPPPARLPELRTRSLGEDAPTLRTAVLENGLRIHLLPIRYEKNTVMASLFFGNGFLALPDAAVPLARMTTAVLGQGGIGALTRADTDFLLQGRGIKVVEDYGAQSSSIAASGGSEHLELMLQAVWTQYTDPAPTEIARNRVLQSLALNSRRRFHTVDGVDRAEWRRYFFGPAKRFAALEETDARGVGLAEIVASVRETRRGGPAHLLISGDFEPEAALALAAGLFGAAPAPAARGPRLAAPPSFPETERHVRVVDDPVAKTVVRMAWFRPLGDEKNRSLLATRRFVALVLRDRLRARLREELGASYSPSAFYWNFVDDEDFGLLQFEISATPANSGQVLEAARSVAGALAEQGVGGEELDLARKPMLTAWSTNRKKTQVWHRMVSDELLYGRPYPQWNNEFADLVASIPPEAVSAEARAIFAEAPFSCLIVTADAPPPSEGKGP